MNIALFVSTNSVKSLKDALKQYFVEVECLNVDSFLITEISLELGIKSVEL